MSASNNTDAKASADGSAVTGGTGTGCGRGHRAQRRERRHHARRIGDADVTAQGVTVEAKMRETGSGDDKDSTHRFGAQATSGAGGGKTGIAGSLAINVANVAADATIAADATVDAGAGDLTLTAEADSESVVKALPEGEGASGTNVGVGASVALNIVEQHAHAQIADDALITGGEGREPHREVRSQAHHAGEAGLVRRHGGHAGGRHRHSEQRGRGLDRQRRRARHHRQARQ